MILPPGQRVRDAANLQRFGTVIGPGAVWGTIMVRWDHTKGARIVRAERVRLVNALKLCL